MTSAEIHSTLIRLASALACGKLLPGIDTDRWYASTPLAERRQIRKAMEAAHEQHKVLAIEMRDMADALARRTTMQSALPQSGDGPIDS